MAFPNAQRTLYKFNPLEEVICQLRFAPILKIDAELPAAFQENIRHLYPFYESKPSIQLPNLPPNLAQIIASGLPFAGQKVNGFASGDRIWNLNLTRDYLSLTCKKYERWEEFRAQLTGPLDSFLNLYKPPFFIRLGLRYRNVIRPAKLSLATVPWVELLKPWLIGALGPTETADDVALIQSTCRLRLPDGIGQTQFVSGLAKDPSNNNEEVLFIDAEFFTDEQTEPKNVPERLNALNRQSGLFFRWCITERLHDALQPMPPD